jgi:hypothetical protein
MNEMRAAFVVYFARLPMQIESYTEKTMLAASFHHRERRKPAGHLCRAADRHLIISKHEMSSRSS